MLEWLIISRYLCDHVHFQQQLILLLCFLWTVHLRLLDFKQRLNHFLLFRQFLESLLSQIKLVLLFLDDHGDHVLAVAFLAEQDRLILVSYYSKACATFFAALASTNTTPASLPGHLLVTNLAQVAAGMMGRLSTIQTEYRVGLLEFFLSH